MEAKGSKREQKVSKKEAKRDQNGAKMGFQSDPNTSKSRSSEKVGLMIEKGVRGTKFWTHFRAKNVSSSWLALAPLVLCRACLLQQGSGNLPDFFLFSFPRGLPAGLPGLSENIPNLT